MNSTGLKRNTIDKYYPGTVLKGIKRISNIQYEFDNTVGPRSISKQELISKFNPLLHRTD
jgi:hypothetical protein